MKNKTGCSGRTGFNIAPFSARMARPDLSSSESGVPGAELAGNRPPEPSRRSVPAESAELV